MNKSQSSANLLVAIPAAFLFFGTFVARYANSPAVIPDEYTYMTNAFFNRSDVGFGNFAFSFLYSSTEACGSYWYHCAKTYNLGFDLVAAIAIGVLIFRITRNSGLSFLSGLIYMVSFGAMYGYAFMPESMYRSLLIIAIASAIILRSRNKWLMLLPAFALGAAMATKPHAFFVWVGLFTAILIYRFGLKRSTPIVGPAWIFLVGSLFFRLVLGLLLVGTPGLNPLGDYLAAVPVIGEAVLAQDQASSLDWALLPAALAAAGMTILPFAALMSVVSISIILTGKRVSDMFSNVEVQILFIVMFSLLLMTSGFMALLELRQLEEGLTRTVSRYWDFMIWPFVSVLFAKLGEVDSPPGKSHRLLTLLGLFTAFSAAALGMLTVFVPQNQADSPMLFGLGGIGALLATLVLLPILLWLSTKKSNDLSQSIVAIVFLGTFLLTWLPFSTYMSEEKAGQAAGNHLVEMLDNYPEDRSRVAIFGERSAVVTAAFLARLENYDGGRTVFYQQVSEKDFKGQPRWVVASKETFFTGESQSITKMGDMVVYELGYPAKIQAIDFDKYSITYSANFAHTYWGSWVLGGNLRFTVPHDVEGKELDLKLLVNEELEDRRVRISFDDEEIEGLLEGDQIITSVLLSREDGGSWAGETIKIEYLGAEDKVQTSGKALGMGFGGFLVYD